MPTPWHVDEYAAVTLRLVDPETFNLDVARRGVCIYISIAHVLYSSCAAGVPLWRWSLYFICAGAGANKWRWVLSSCSLYPTRPTKFCLRSTDKGITWNLCERIIKNLQYLLHCYVWWLRSFRESTGGYKQNYLIVFCRCLVKLSIGTHSRSSTSRTTAFRELYLYFSYSHITQQIRGYLKINKLPANLCSHTK